MTLVVTTEAGTVSVPGHVLVGIAVRAAESVEGIRVRRSRHPRSGGGAGTSTPARLRRAYAAIDVERRHVRLSVAARRGEPLVELAERVQEAVAGALRAMCGIDTKVDVAVGALE